MKSILTNSRSPWSVEGRIGLQQIVLVNQKRWLETHRSHSMNHIALFNYYIRKERRYSDIEYDLFENDNINFDDILSDGTIPIITFISFFLLQSRSYG